ncbi:YncE family protein [Melioribacteraceae bacterium 4301-Me]|uniref:YncE family protein n=1 Tax=Pyranulibacter aquaticus TaxID=3163344 RepID=UPI00359841F6
MIAKSFVLFNLILISAITFGCNSSPTEPGTTENKMYVYSNYGKTFYLLDYKTFEVVKEINLSIPDTITINGMILSTDRKHLFLKVEGQYPSPPFGFAVYNIEGENLENIFFTDFKDAEPAYFIAAQNKTEPGLIYVRFRDFGTYSIDLYEQKIQDFISGEHDFVLDERIYPAIGDEWDVIHKHWSGDIKGSFSELEFYLTNSGLHNLQFTLNKNNQDSISIYDFKLSKDNRLFITYQLSDGHSRNIESYFGIYNLETKQLYRSSLKFPWSLSGYFLGYSINRNEVYSIGSDGRFYIIDTNTYIIKDTINLGVSGEQSPIIISPDDNFAFVAYPSSNSIFVIDLNNRKVIKTISVKEPYNMIIP